MIVERNRRGVLRAVVYFAAGFLYGTVFGWRAHRVDTEWSAQ